MSVIVSEIGETPLGGPGYRVKFYEPTTFVVALYAMADLCRSNELIFTFADDTSSVAYIKPTTEDIYDANKLQAKIIKTCNERLMTKRLKRAGVEYMGLYSGYHQFRLHKQRGGELVYERTLAFVGLNPELVESFERLDNRTNVVIKEEVLWVAFLQRLDAYLCEVFGESYGQK